MGYTVSNDPVGTMRGSLCSGNCAGLGDGLTRMLTPLDRGELCPIRARDLQGYIYVGIIHKIVRYCKIMSITRYCRVSRGEEAGGIFSAARRERLFCGKPVMDW